MMKMINPLVLILIVDSPRKTTNLRMKVRSLWLSNDSIKKYKGRKLLSADKYRDKKLDSINLSEIQIKMAFSSRQKSAQNKLALLRLLWKRSRTMKKNGCNKN